MELFLASLQAACPDQSSELSVGLEGHLHRKMVTDGKGLEGDRAKPQKPCWAACLPEASPQSCPPPRMEPTGFLKTTACGGAGQ